MIQEIIVKWAIGVLLFLCTVQDLYCKKIAVWMVLAGALIVGGGTLFSHSFSFGDCLGGLSTGLAVILISLATKGKIGIGDGLLLCVTGIGLGLWDNLELFAAALFLAAILSVLLLIFRLADRKKNIPFVPFLFAGYLFLLVMNGSSIT